MSRQRSLAQTWRHLGAGLRRHYLADPKQVFKQFKLGAMCFAVGLTTVLYLASQVPPSALQELGVLLALLLALAGFSIALLAEVRLLIGRILVFLRKT